MVVVVVVVVVVALSSKQNVRLFYDHQTMLLLELQKEVLTSELIYKRFTPDIHLIAIKLS